MRGLRIAIVILAAAGAAMAQDTRKITEPSIPPTCAVVTAHFASRGGTLDEATDTTPDTSRIQAAIDGCAAGHSVALRADRDSAHFFPDRCSCALASRWRWTRE